MKAAPLVVIQRNPRSGTGRGRRQLLILAEALKSKGYRVRMFGRRVGMDRWLARQSRESVKCIVAAGGDGTVADLCNRHPELPLAILPMGTENLLARFLGLKRCGKTLADVIDRNQVECLDTALAGSVRFLLMLSSGVDADIVHALHSVRTGNISRLSYVFPSLRAFFLSPVRRFEAISVDGLSRIEGSHLIVTNVPRYGFNLPFAPDAIADDGKLDVRAFDGKTRWQIFWHAVGLKLRLPILCDRVTRFQTNEVTIRPVREGGDISQCDGDPGPALPLTVRVHAGSLRVFSNRQSEQ